MNQLNNIKVSIVVTTYNRESFLKQTLYSILNQSYQDFELIVVDNYSDYDFLGLIDSLGSSKIHAFQNDNNGIIAINRNYGIKKARGKYIAFCDDDDLWMPNKLEMQVKYMESHEEIDIIGTAMTLFGDDIKGTADYYYKKYSNEYEYYCRNYVTPSTVLVKNTKDICFNESPQFNCAEDWTLWMTLYILGYRLYQMPEPLVKYRLYSQNLTKKSGNNQYRRGSRILRYLKRTYGNKFKNEYFVYGMIYQYKMYLWEQIKHLLYPLYKVSLRPVVKMIKK
jgi:glycosyltransferase involved in cell wall biosynthesis